MGAGCESAVKRGHLGGGIRDLLGKERGHIVNLVFYFTGRAWKMGDRVGVDTKRRGVRSWRQWLLLSFPVGPVKGGLIGRVAEHGGGGDTLATSLH